jgi:hypothetical protein
MNDDYLWDRSGEPDREVERLERVLGKYRYQAKPLSPALHSRLSERRGGWIRLAAVAAAILIVLAGLWIFRVQNKSVTSSPESANVHGQPEKQDKDQEVVTPVKEREHVPRLAVAPNAPRKTHRNASTETLADTVPYGDSDLVAERQPIINPFIDIETARHIERAQLLLRSFRNTRDSGAQPDPNLSYEKQRSRGLLYKNILLRRDAEAKGNMPAEELLGSLEPFLLDIANLPDRPSNEDVRSIKERMQKKEIVSALQVYSAPTLSQVF